MRLDFISYMIPEKIYILGAILTFIERTITSLKVHEFWVALNIAKYWSELFSGLILAFYVEYYLILRGGKVMLIL